MSVKLLNIFAFSNKLVLRNKVEIFKVNYEMRLIMMPVIMYGTDITFLFTPLGWDASSANNPALETGRSDCYLLLLSLLINTYS